MGPRSTRVVVVGAGIAGLSCAVALAEAGHDVRVVAADPPARTVSAVAGGLWFPYGTDRSDVTLDRARAGYERFEALGVAMTDYLLLGEEDPWWRPALPPRRVRPARAAELPAGYGAGHVCRVPLVESPRHLRELTERALELGARLERRRVTELAQEGPLVVNCAGLGARELAGDHALTAVRGQVVHLRPPAGVRVRCVADDGGPNALAYVLPRGDLCVAGGTAEPVGGADPPGRPDPAVRSAILERCARIAPEITGATVLADRVGLRPVRTGGVRLEAEVRPDGGVTIHNYGHGGAGWTLAWGCALAVRDLIRAA